MKPTKLDYEKIRKGHPYRNEMSCYVFGCQNLADYIFHQEATINHFMVNNDLDPKKVMLLMCSECFKEFKYCQNCGQQLGDKFGHSSYHLNPKKTICVCEDCNILEIRLRIKAFRK